MTSNQENGFERIFDPTKDERKVAEMFSKYIAFNRWKFDLTDKVWYKDVDTKKIGGAYFKKFKRTNEELFDEFITNRNEFLRKKREENKNPY